MATKSKKAPRRSAPKLERLSADTKPPKGLTPKQLKAWHEAMAAGSGKTWKPEMGDTLAGKLVSTSEVKGQFGMQRVLDVRPNGEKAAVRVYCNTILAKRYEEMQPKVGADVVLIHKGFAKGQKGRPAKIIEMRVA